MTTSELRAESAMVQQEAGGEMTTRAAMLLGAADEIDRLAEENDKLKQKIEEQSWLIDDYSGRRR